MEFVTIEEERNCFRYRSARFVTNSQGSHLLILLLLHHRLHFLLRLLAG